MAKEFPFFALGQNIAIKIPPHEFEDTLKFYRDILGMKEVAREGDSIAFQFGDKQLWLDKVKSVSQAEIWFEIKCSDIANASKHFHESGIVRCDKIEELPQGFDGFWISSPCNIIHLISNE
jgi:hypothetical protein